MSIVRRAAPLAGPSAAITTEPRRWWPPSAASHECRVHKVAAGKSLQPPLRSPCSTSYNALLASKRLPGKMRNIIFVKSSDAHGAGILRL